MGLQRLRHDWATSLSYDMDIPYCIYAYYYSTTTTTKSLQSCPTLCNPMDCSPPGFSVHGILQARTLEWVAISFSKAWKWKVKVKSLSRVWLFVTPWTAAHQASLSITNSQSLHKLRPIRLVMPLSHLSLCYSIFHLALIFPSIRVFSNESVLHIMAWGQSIGASASASVLPMNIQDWFPLGLTGLISLQSKGHSRVFYNSTVQMHKFLSAQLSLWSNSHHTWHLEKP